MHVYSIHISAILIRASPKGETTPCPNFLVVALTDLSILVSQVSGPTCKASCRWKSLSSTSLRARSKPPRIIASEVYRPSWKGVHWFMGVSINGGTPIVGWFMMEQIVKKDDLPLNHLFRWDFPWNKPSTSRYWRYPIYGNDHIGRFIKWNDHEVEHRETTQNWICGDSKRWTSGVLYGSIRLCGAVLPDPFGWTLAEFPVHQPVIPNIPRYSPTMWQRVQVGLAGAPGVTEILVF